MRVAKREGIDRHKIEAHLGDLVDEGRIFDGVVGSLHGNARMYVQTLC